MPRSFPFASLFSGGQQAKRVAIAAAALFAMENPVRFFSCFLDEPEHRHWIRRDLNQRKSWNVHCPKFWHRDWHDH